MASVIDFIKRLTKRSPEPAAPREAELPVRRPRSRAYFCSAETLENRLLLSLAAPSILDSPVPAALVSSAAREVSVASPGDVPIQAAPAQPPAAVSAGQTIASAPESLTDAALQSLSDVDLLGTTFAGPPHETTSPLAFAAQGPIQITLRVSGTQLELIDSKTGDELASAPLATTSEVDVTGVAHSVTTFTVDFSGGAIPLPINYDGGSGGDNTLIIQGGQFAGTSYSSSGPHSGTITLGPTEINYTNLTPIVDNTVVNDRVFNDPAPSGDLIELVAGATAGTTKIESGSATPAFENVTFANPANSLTINAGPGTVTIDLESVDPAFGAQIFVNGGGGNDTLEGPNQASQFVVTGNLSGSLNAPAPVTFTGIQNLQGGTAADQFVIQNGATLAQSPVRAERSPAAVAATVC